METISYPPFLGSKLADGGAMCELEPMADHAATPLQALRMRRTLAGPLEAPIWPEGVQPVNFSSEHAPGVRALLALAYAQGGGSVVPFSEWWSALSNDAEFDAALCFLAQDLTGRIIGVAQCWSTAFVKDLAVHPHWRRRGLGRALLLHAFAVFKERNAGAVYLKVEAGNTAAIALYESVDMQVMAT
jgi:GNAT superfamily N-acetyltransferase